MASTYTVNKSIEKPAYNDYAANPTGWSGPVNTDWDIIDKSFGGTTVKNPTGVSGTVNLVASEYQSAILVIGVSISSAATLTANVVYQIPSGVGGTWNVYNNTTGAFTVTFANAGGGTTFAIPQGEKRIIYSDGTNIRESVTLPAVYPPPFAAGTAIVFAQTAAPTGWTKSTTHDNKALRVVSGAASSGGTVSFTSAFTSQAVAGTVGSTTLTLDQIPAHNHEPIIAGGGNSSTSFYPNALSSTPYSAASRSPGWLSTQGGGLGHTHTFTGTAINLAVQYVDVIIATKD
jgi:hypothetical protein